jgi:pimeloyl-ACP methyl ester carboxylesterase
MMLSLAVRGGSAAPHPDGRGARRSRREKEYRALLRHCTVAIALALGAMLPAGAQPAAPTAPGTGESALTIFIRGVEAGRMQSTVSHPDTSWVVSSTGRFGDIVLNRLEIKYDADWQPTSMRVEATQVQKRLVLLTSFGLTTAVNELSQDGATTAKTDQISARAVVLPNNFYAGYEALAVRLAASETGAEIPIYVPPQGEVKALVKEIGKESIQTPAGITTLRTYNLLIHNVGADVEATVAVDARNRFARLEIKAAALSVVRSDLAGVSARRQTMRNPTDTDVTIPTTGFNIAGTLTMPRQEGRLRHPVVVLVGGAGPVDRDETVADIPVFGQLAGALAERGFMVLRYDKRGVGQSGGRPETITLQDYADDAVAIVKWLAKRDDVDSQRIAVLGYGEGGSAALLAAGREKKIASLILVATAATTGADFVLEQQRHQLALLKIPDADRQQKIDLQQRVQTAVLAGQGWEGVPDDVRKQAETPWFKSLLEFDPAKAMTRVTQPILIVQGDLDTQVPPHHAEQLADLARKRKKTPPVESVHLPGVNHLLVKAATGEADEYAKLAPATITVDAATTIANWLRR